MQQSDDFLDTFMSVMKKLQTQDFIAKQQSKCLQMCKDNLELGQNVVIGDSAENYSFDVQDASQSFHWNNMQVTIHPFVCYYKSRGKLEHISFVVISECNTHDTV